MPIETDIREMTFDVSGSVLGKASVFYACLAAEPGSGPSAGGINPGREDEKHRLVSMLWNHLAARKNPLWMRDESKDGRVFPFRVARGLLGKPRLLWGEYPGPAVSFSQSGDKRWAALCGDGFDIGIDVAESRDFRGAYPFNRVFHPQELAHALKLAGNDLEEASALLWSIKEAFVKALGCGFHLVDPKQIMVDPTDGPPLREKNAHAFSVSLLERAASRFPVFKDRFLQARSFCFGKMWLSIALLHRRDGCDPEQRSLNTRNPWRQRRN